MKGLPPPPKVSDACDHVFVHMDTKKRTGDGGYKIKFTRIDTFFCQRCLEQKAVKKEEYSRDTPEWY